MSKQRRRRARRLALALGVTSVPVLGACVASYWWPGLLTLEHTTQAHTSRLSLGLESGHLYADHMPSVGRECFSDDPIPGWHAWWSIERAFPSCGRSPMPIVSHRSYGSSAGPGTRITAWSPLPSAAALGVAAWIWRLTRRECGPAACPACGYPLATLTTDRCPECGEPIAT